MEINERITRKVYNDIGNNKFNLLRNSPRYLGLIPYELYIIPGMFIAIIHLLWSKSITPLQVHLLPHWFIFSMVTYIKNNIKRGRPGCSLKGMSIRDSSTHCKKASMKSFPSGHTAIAIGLATSMALLLLKNPDDKFGKLFGVIDYDNMKVRYATVIALYFMGIMTAIHRISYGYHYVSDTVIGGILGMMIAYVSYEVIERNKKMVEEKIEENDKIWEVIKWIGTVLCVMAIVHFFMHEFAHLANIEH